MKIAFDLNGVIRDVFLKAEQVYTKFYLEEKPEEEDTSKYDEENDEWVKDEEEDTFEYSLNLYVQNYDFANNG